ncbi:MAG: N-formylglutamate amidohydrolase [Rhizobiaceae bacterium]
MSNQIKNSLLNVKEQPSVEIINRNGKSNIVLVCEHASNRMPASLDNLGLETEAVQSHAAWDPGALRVAQYLSKYLDAPLVAARYSRLVYDLNRPPENPQAMNTESEIYAIPGNQNLSIEEKQSRTEELYIPFHKTVSDVMDRVGDGCVMITIHTFTPIYFGKQRTVELGILHDADTRFADGMLENSAKHTGMVTLRNDPYGPKDGVTHTLVKHGISRGCQNVMLEIRNDLVETAEQQIAVGKQLVGLIKEANLDML